MTLETRFRCSVCGKVTSGRVPRQGKLPGDGTVRYPRHHLNRGKLCKGVYEEAEWVDAPPPRRSRMTQIRRYLESLRD